MATNVSMQLVGAIRCRHRPIILIDAPNSVANIIKECWLHDYTCTSRPIASAVSHIMQELLSAANVDDLTDGVMNDATNVTESINTCQYNDICMAVIIHVAHMSLQILTK